jgi:pimeloyl-ACP methyl ester carboxylesterase
MKSVPCAVLLAFVGAAATRARAAEEWEGVLNQALAAEHSQTRYDGLKQVDTSTAKGLKALWAVLAIRDPNKVDWYVREGAFEALSQASGEEAEKEIDRVVKEGIRGQTAVGGGSGGGGGGGGGGDLELAKEAIVYSIIWRIRKAANTERGGNDDHQIEEVKIKLRKTRGVEYFGLVLPVIEQLDPEKKQLARIQQVLADKSPRVRRAAITGLTWYPDHSSVPLLIDNLKKLEKQRQKNLREWVLTRHAIETLTGQYFRDDVESWVKWWDIQKNQFTIKKRIEEEADKESGEAKTVVAKKDGVEVTVHMKVVGAESGYPLLVLPWRGHEVDYFRPYFHEVEEFCRVYYVRMPQLGDFKGLARDAKSNLVNYPTNLLAKALADIMQEVGLDSFAILGHGPDACTLSMMLAAQNPNRVSHLLLVNPRSSGEAYGPAIQNVRREGQRTGNKEVVKGADSITMVSEDGKVKYDPSDSAEAEGLTRSLNNLRHADPTEPETGALFYLYGLVSGDKVLADDKWSARDIFKNKRTDFPVLILMGEKAPWTPVNDMNSVAGLFKSATVVKFKNSAEMPFISETALFTKSLEDFFRPALLAQKKKKDKEAKDKNKGRPAVGGK